MSDSEAKTDQRSFPQTIEELSEVLVGRGCLTAEQAREVSIKAGLHKARLSKTGRDLSGRPIRKIKVEPSPAEIIATFNFQTEDGKILGEDKIMQEIAEVTGYPYLKIDPLELDMDLVTKSITRPFAQKHVMVPVGKKGDSLIVALDNPTDIEGLDMIMQATGLQVETVLSSRTDIRKIITEFYGFRTSVTAAEAELRPSFDIQNLEQYVRMKAEGTFDPSDKPIVNAVEYLLRYAYEQRASDIHIEPKRDYSIVRLRIDGVLHPVHRMPKIVHSAVASRIKMLGRMDIAEKRRPQDGRIKTDHGGKEIELRVSTLPVAFGEKVVIRIFDPEVLMQEVEELGFHPKDYALFKKFISQPHGIILVTGPTGSGKTTTLYSALKILAQPAVNVVTIEDPIEMVYEEFNQVAIQPKLGLGFAESLRTILRQDPDIVMVGEIRDRDTAEHAVQAALTGHLVFSTLHTNDAATSITRLRELDIESFLISSTILGVVAQRLVRVICPNCKKKTELSEEDVRSLGIVPKPGVKYVVHYGEGCITCRQTGYLGRTGVYEVLDVNDKIKRLVLEGEDAAAIKKAAIENGMSTLREGAIRKLGAGITTYEEVLRVTAQK